MSALLARRSVLRIAAVATVAVPTIAHARAPDPAMAAFLAVQSATATFEASADGPEADAAYDEFCAAIGRLVRAQPTTIDGVLAKVDVARKRVADGCDHDADALLASLLVLDPATLAGAGHG